MAMQPPEELSEEQVEAIKEVFLLFDQDGDETISINDLGTVMRQLGQNPTEAELAAIIAEIDADGNKIVEFPELVDLMSRRPWGHQGSERELTKAFEPFDRDADGGVNLTEMRHMLTQMGEKLTDEEVDEMFNMFTADGDGKVKSSDLVKLMTDCR